MSQYSTDLQHLKKAELERPLNKETIKTPYCGRAITNMMDTKIKQHLYLPQICPIFPYTEMHHVIPLTKSPVWALVTLIQTDLIFF